MAQYTALPADYMGAIRPAGAVPAVLLHGFTQSRSSWRAVLPYLGARPLVLPDLPGHGRAAGIEAGLWATADLLSDLVSGPSAWVGYSMGGRIALHLALSHPGLVKRLVLISATAGIADEAERGQRRAGDEKLAARVETEGVDAFLAWWLSQPLFSTLPAERADREGRRANTAAGLASSLRLAGTGSQSPLWDRLVELRRARVPVLCVAGALDSKYVGLAGAMARALGPQATTLVVEGAGHACHLERPDVVGPAIAAFLDRGKAGLSDGPAGPGAS